MTSGFGSLARIGNLKDQGGGVFHLGAVRPVIALCVDLDKIAHKPSARLRNKHSNRVT